MSVHYKEHPYAVLLSSLQVSTTKLIFSSSSLLVQGKQQSWCISTERRDKGQCVTEAGRSLKSVTFLDKTKLTVPYVLSKALNHCAASRSVTIKRSEVVITYNIFLSFFAWEAGMCNLLYRPGVSHKSDIRLKSSRLGVVHAYYWKNRLKA